MRIKQLVAALVWAASLACVGDPEDALEEIAAGPANIDTPPVVGVAFHSVLPNAPGVMFEHFLRRYDDPVIRNTAREQLQTLRYGEAVLIALGGDREAAHVLHCKVRKAVFRGAGFVNFCDAVVIHERQCLTFAFESRDRFRRIQSRTKQLERDFASHGPTLSRTPYRPHPAFAKTLDQLERADLLPRRSLRCARQHALRKRRMGGNQQLFHFLAK